MGKGRGLKNVRTGRVTFTGGSKDTFFPNMWNLPICDILSNRRGKYKFLDLQGDASPPQFPRLVGYPDLSIRKTLMVVGLSKQKIYCM